VAFKRLSLAIIAAGLAWLTAGPARGEPDLQGQTGLINMPDGRVEPDGTWRLGYSYSQPYAEAWSSLTFLKFLELNVGYTRLMDVPAFTGTEFQSTYGSYKDKELGLKLHVLEESKYIPSVSVGGYDLYGTTIFKSGFLAASKRVSSFDFTLGYGINRIDGFYGGVRYKPEFLPGLGVVAEYDATKWSQDYGANLSGVNQRTKGFVGGLEYRWKWLGAQVSYNHDTVAFNGYVSVPLQDREFVPKVDEPEVYTTIAPRPTLAQWQEDRKYGERMVSELLKEDFKVIRVRLEGTTVKAELTNTRISLVSRAVGRAARVILLTSPLETTEIEIVYMIADVPFAVYTFTDVARLQRYFNGMMSRKEIEPYITVRFAAPSDGFPSDAKSVMLESFDQPYHVELFSNTQGDLITFYTEGSGLERFKISPALAFYVNDPSGALRYDLYLQALYQRELAKQLFFVGALTVTLAQDVSDVNNPNNSTLPHVRTDINFFMADQGIVNLNRLLLNKYFLVAPRTYARASVGFYEMMYAGGGGQVLYFPESGRWAVDLAVDALKERAFTGWFQFQSYQTVTAIGSFHYRIPNLGGYLEGLTATVRAGAFLAKDTGARFELKRRFNSGVEVGFWYTRTNGHDVTPPGSPGSPYYDKGVYVMIPLNAMLTKDTQVNGAVAIAPWTRDVGQMVISPGDLYGIVENPLIDVTTDKGLYRLNE